MQGTILKYTIIKDRNQYDKYCDQLESLLTQENDAVLQDEIDLITLLIEKYDEEQNPIKETDPITLLRSFMKDHNLKPQDMTQI